MALMMETRKVAVDTTKLEIEFVSSNAFVFSGARSSTVSKSNDESNVGEEISETERSSIGVWVQYGGRGRWECEEGN
ncbi:hypothetical protein LINPERPRIM_LOCUS18421 [Linum perenne]